MNEDALRDAAIMCHAWARQAAGEAKHAYLVTARRFEDVADACRDRDRPMTEEQFNERLGVLVTTALSSPIPNDRVLHVLLSAQVTLGEHLAEKQPQALVGLRERRCSACRGSGVVSAH
ncbi:hypothetical protein [Acuticoccus sediminis]|uniref:hypothetical protein n=1 Tax=Acuticoccus sediminis TaxID=2184697 RepID=UPI001CFECCA4|nr:hypothetical protein [Acuticoccus sediminis]